MIPTTTTLYEGVDYSDASLKLQGNFTFQILENDVRQYWEVSTAAETDEPLSAACLQAEVTITTVDKKALQWYQLRDINVFEWTYNKWYYDRFSPAKSV